MTPETKAKDLIALLDKLVNVLEQETLALSEPRTSVLSPLVQEKQMLMTEYENFLGGLVPNFFQTIGDPMKANLKTLSERFQNAALENEKRLSIATRSSQMIADRIKEEAEKSMGTKIQSYGQTGGYASSRNQRAAPIAINQTL